MASATPVSSEGGTRLAARAARGVRGLHHDTASPHVADAGIAAHRSGYSLMSSSLDLRTAHVPRLYLEAIIYPHVHAPKYILHRLSWSYTDQSFLSCATHRNVLSLDVAKGRRYCWRRCFRFGRSVTRSVVPTALSCQCFEQRLGLLEGCGVKALGEPCIDRRQERTHFGLLGLLLPQPAQAQPPPQRKGLHHVVTQARFVEGLVP